MHSFIIINMLIIITSVISVLCLLRCLLLLSFNRKPKEHTLFVHVIDTRFMCVNKTKANKRQGNVMHGSTDQINADGWVGQLELGSYKFELVSNIYTHVQQQQQNLFWFWVLFFNFSFFFPSFQIVVFFRIFERAKEIIETRARRTEE